MSRALNLVPVRSKTTLEELLRIEATRKRTTQRSDVLASKQFKVADLVFQWRLTDENLMEDQKHTLELARILKDQDKPLEPILVTPIGSGFYVVDGHHRLQAYRTARWEKTIPVVYFEGTVQEACLEAFRLNCKNKLPMTIDDKREAAWRLLKDGKMSQTTISTETSVSLRTISTRSKTLKDFGERVRELTWRRAKSLKWVSEEELPDMETWKEKKAQAMTKQLLKNLTKDAYKYPDVLAMALRQIDDNLAQALRGALNDLYHDNPEDED